MSDMFINILWGGIMVCYVAILTIQEKVNPKRRIFMPTKRMFFFIREFYTPNTIFYTHLEVTKNTEIIILCKKDCWEIRFNTEENSVFLKIPAMINLEISPEGLPLYNLEKLIENLETKSCTQEYKVSSTYDPSDESRYKVKLPFHPEYIVKINIKKQE